MLKKRLKGNALAAADDAIVAILAELRRAIQDTSVEHSAKNEYRGRFGDRVVAVGVCVAPHQTHFAAYETRSRACDKMAANGEAAKGGGAEPKVEKVLTTKASGHTERREEFKSEGLTTAGEEEPSHRASPPAPATRESRASARSFASRRSSSAIARAIARRFAPAAA
jgi:hypothetical protein